VHADAIPVVITHDYPFDPTYGYALAALLRVEAPAPPADYGEFWRSRYARALAMAPHPEVRDTGQEHHGWRVFDLLYTSTDRVRIGGWLLVPAMGPVRRGFVIGHGYGGRTAPDFHWPLREAALLFPCCRGLGRSPLPPVSAEAQWHVLHNIHDREQYILGGCVEDIWLAVSALLRLRPEVQGHIGYAGSSFGGGIGAMALALDDRLHRAHLCVPSFGHHPLRLRLPTTGSAASVQQFVHAHPEVLHTLRYYDAAAAARSIHIPVHCACARFDPVVAPPGQFAIYNALSGPKELFVLPAGHHPFPGQASEEQGLLQTIARFFEVL
jgi:cephalosporin-C deacetylase